MSMAGTHCEPFMLLGSSRRQQLTQSLLQTFQAWRQQWGGNAHTPFVVDCADSLTRRAAMPGGRTIAFGADAVDGPLLVIAIPMDMQHELLGVTAPRSPLDGGEIASAVITEAVQALCLRLSEPAAAERMSVHAYQADKLAQAWGRYGCTVTLKTAADRVLLSARLSPQLLLAMLPTPGNKSTEPVASRRSAIGEEVVDVHAWLGEAEVTLADLTTLQIGDVILLQASVNGAGYLALPDGRQLASIRLGRVAEQRAVNVVGKAGR